MIAEMGAIAILVGALIEDVEAVKEQAAAALRNLANTSANRVRSVCAMHRLH